MGRYDTEEKRAEERARTAGNYRWLKEHGYCTSCGTERAEPGRSVCLSCKMRIRERRRERRRERKAENPEAEKQRLEKKAAAARERRLIRAAQGMCTTCGKRPAEQGRKRCAVCRAKAKIAYKKWYDKKRPPKAPGTCRSCNMPALPGKMYCEDHYKKLVKLAAKATEASKRSGKTKNRIDLLWKGMIYHARRKADQKQGTG